MKSCRRCSVEKPLLDFHKHSSRKDGHTDWCKPCTAIYDKQHRSKNLRHHKSNDLYRKYGITLDTFESMLKKQKGLCSICNENKKLHVDHCHTTGLVRGLLCSNCNTALGLFKENKSSIAKAYHYIGVFENGKMVIGGCS